MLETETENIRQYLIARTIGGRDAMAFKDLRRAGLPAGVMAFLRAELREWVTNDLRGTPTFKNINRSSTEIPKLTKGFVSALMEEYLYPRQEFLASLDNAVHFLGNYLCRPRWTMEHFLFEKSSSIPVVTLMELLEYTHDYRYFRTLIDQVVRRKGWSDVRRDDFARMIAMIDDEVVKKQGTRDLAYMLKPLADFLLIADPSTGNTVPVKAVQVFFEDKKMMIVKEHVGKTAATRGVTTVTLNELAAIIDGLSSSDHTVAPAEPMQPTEATPPAPSHEDTGGGQTQPDVRDTGEDSLPEPPSETHKPARESQNVALSLTFAGISEPPARSPLPDLNALISGEQRERFIKHIFQRDPAYFAGILTRLNHTSSWKEASVYLNHLFQINDVDPFALDVVEFTDVVQSRYTTDTQPTG
jgi:hypothetical protein